jgi:tetratricopeptide (TPR) repeat protein
MSQLNISMGYDLLEAREYQKALEVFRTINSRAKMPRTRIDALIGMCLAHRDSGDTNGALGMAAKALEMDPKNPVANYNIGNLYEEMGQHALAIQHYDMVIVADPSNKESYNNRGVAWYHAGKIKEAANDFKNALKIDPDYIKALINAGMCHLEDSKYESAIDSFDVALKQDSENVHALLGKGLALYYLDRYDDSIICFEAATSIKRDFYIAHYHKATILRKLDLLNDAEAAISESISIRKDYPQGHFELGNIRKAKGDIKGALEAYGKAESTGKGDNEEVLYEIGRIYLYELDEPQIALSYFKRIIRKNPDIAKVWYESGIAFSKDPASLDKAKYSLENAIHLGLDNLETKRALAEVSYELKDLRAAMEILEEITDNYPDAISHLMKAKIELSSREYSDAIDSSEQALSLDSNLHEALLIMGKSYNSLGKVEEYKQCLRRYINSNPNDDDVRKELELMS